MKKIKAVLLVILIGALVIIFMPWCGSLYEKIIGRNISPGFWGPSHPEYFEGFFISYSFFVTLIVTIFGGRKKYIILGIAIGLLFLLNIVSATWDSLVINVVTAVIAWIIGEIILLICKLIKKPKQKA